MTIFIVLVGDSMTDEIKSFSVGPTNILTLPDRIETKDFVHPSPIGIKFISQEIAEFIFKNRLLPL